MSIAEELKVFAKHQKILVVEDDLELREELVNLLSLFFKSVDEACDGKDGLKKYQQGKYDIVLSDITMPNMDCIKMSSEIKNIYREQSIVMLSAHNDLEFLIELIDIGINQFVAKPFEAGNLLYRLLKVSENITLKNEFERMKKLTVLNSVKKNTNTESHPPSTIFKDVLDQSVSITKKEKKTNMNSSEELSSNLSHKQKDASSFMQSLQGDSVVWMAFENEMDEMMELDDDFQYYIDRIYLNNITNDDIAHIARILRNFYRIFLIIDELQKMAHAMYELGNYLESIDVDILSQNQIKKLKILEFIHDDLSRFIQTVFVYQDTIDIHYLEDSLISSVEQLKVGVSETVVEEEDLELF